MKVLEIIEQLQEGGRQGGAKLTDLALPQDMYDTLLIELGDKAVYINGVLNVNGTPIHTGEND